MRHALRESVFAASPSTLTQDIEIARRAKDIYTALPGKQKVLGIEIRKLRKQVELLSFQKKPADLRMLPRLAPGPTQPAIQKSGAQSDNGDAGSFGRR